jgi:hypothetical protein
VSRLALALAVVLGVGISGGLVTVPREAQCAYCPSYPCYGACGTGCVCMRKNTGTGGECVTFERAPGLERQGWTRLR